MKVAVVAGAIHKATSGVYGSESQSATLARGFVRAGHDVTFIAAAGSDPVGNFCPIPCMYGNMNPNEEVRGYEWYRDELVRQDLIIDASATHRVSENLYFWDREAFKGVLLWSHQGNIFTSPRPPVIHTYHGTVFSEAQKEHALAHWFFPLRRMHPSRLHVIPYGIDTEVYRPAENPTRDYFLYLSRPHPHKGIFEFLQLARDFPKERFVMAFDMAAPDHVQYGNEAIRQAKADHPNVEYVPLKGKLETKVKLYQNAKALVTPLAKEYLEGFGLVFAEAMACLPAGEPVSTRRGLVPIEQVRVGDWVLTHRGRYRPVVRLHQRPFVGELCMVGTPYHSVKLTPNHEVLTSQGWIPAERLPPGPGTIPADAARLLGGPHGRGRDHWSSDREVAFGSRLHRDPLHLDQPGRLSGADAGVGPEAPGWPYLTVPIQGSTTRVGRVGQDVRGSHPQGPLAALEGQEKGRAIGASVGPLCGLARRGHVRGLGLVPAERGSGASGERGESTEGARRVAGAYRWLPLAVEGTLPHVGTVYNLGVLDDNSYVAGGVVVHNCGTPCITATHGGQVDVVGDLGWLCATHEEYLEAIKDVARAGYDPLSPARLCRERIVRRFSVKRWVAAYLKLYTKVRRELDTAPWSIDWLWEKGT